MTRGSDPSRDSDVRAQAAVVRALVEELRRIGPDNHAAVGVRTQLIEESGRLAFLLATVDTGDIPSEAPHHVIEEGSAAHPRHRVLVVEDDDGTRTALAKWLAEDYDVVTAPDGEEGFALASARPPDVIVTDLWMPRVDGISMINRIKCIESMSGIPVIFVTGQTAGDTIRDRISSGPVAYLPKPIEFDALGRALRVALTKSATHQEE